ncbi:hypothetical protein ABFS83_02G140100 [Erythranthe nasuta]
MSFAAVRARAVRTARNYYVRELDAESLENLKDVAPYIRRHLNQFYSTLFFATASSAIGSYVSLSLNVGSSLPAFGAFITVVWFNFTPPWKENKRACLLSLGTFFGWASLAPWLTWFLNVDTNFVVASISTTSIGFCCLWAASKWSTHFVFIYSRAMLYNCILAFICLHIGSAVLGGDLALWKYELFLWLLWNVIYVAVYSQEVVLKARKGESDYVRHAVNVYTDLPPIVITVIRLAIEAVRNSRSR